MLISESILCLSNSALDDTESKKVRVNTYVVEANYVKPNTNNKKQSNDNNNTTKYHCPYHSYNNNSNHNESDCFVIKKGLTKVDPSNS